MSILKEGAMRQLFVMLLVFTTVIVSLAFVALGTQDTDVRFFVRVTSVDPGEEIEFEGSLATGYEKSNLEQITETTPFEIELNSTAFLVMLHDKVSDRVLKIELIDTNTREIIAMAESERVILGREMPAKHGHFAVGF
jgi:hypothetical protein